MKKETLWSRNYILLMSATTMGAIGGIAGSYAMSFLVFDETGSTLATGFLTALQIIPYFLLPIFVAPWMDRLPRKPFLVMGDLFGGFLYAMAALYLRRFEFSYPGYLLFSVVINSVNAFDSLAFNCIFPNVIPKGFEDKGYTFSAMLYPMMNVLIMPVAAYLMDSIGISNILFLQSGMSVLAAITENCVDVQESIRLDEKKSGLSLWLQDFKDGIQYLKGERGLLNIYTYDAVTNGASTGYNPILVAFFRTTPGFSAQLFAFFSAAEFLGRTAGGLFRYHTQIKPEYRRRFVYWVQQFYNLMDAVLLWLPYPAMLANKGICGFLGINSATVRASSIHQYLPEEYRARVNAFSSAAICTLGSVASIVFGAMGEFLSYRWTTTVTSVICMFLCWLTVGRNGKLLDKIYMNQ